MNYKKHTVIVIVGPTAVGKTALSLGLAQLLQTPIISADSRQCFTELNIGVAKPTIGELNLVKHYFINTHHIQEEVNAGIFERYALEAVKEIFKTNTTAVMVGGTGLYIKAFCEGIDLMPVVPPEIRDNIALAYETQGIGFLQDELRAKDPAFWQVAEQQNPQRLMRALEILYATGKSITGFRKKASPQRPFNIIKIGLQLPKEHLHDNINNRVDGMMQAGLAEEVKSLLPYQLLNALQTVGYKELFDFYNGNCSLAEAVNQIKINTRHYAKRQITWFKKDQDIHWLPAQTAAATDIVKLVPL